MSESGIIGVSVVALAAVIGGGYVLVNTETVQAGYVGVLAHGYCSPCDIRFRPWNDEEKA